IVADVPGIRRGCVVAFGVPHPTLGTESLVVVAETRETHDAARDALVAAVIERVTAAVGLPPDAVELVGPGVVPKASSGRIQRQATRALSLQHGLGATTRTSWLPRARLLAAAVWAEARKGTGVARSEERRGG